MSRPTKWSGAPTRYKELGRNKLNTIISGQLTHEQIDAYQNYFRVEEISHLFRVAHERRRPLLSLLPSGTEGTQYQRDPSPPPKYDSRGQRTNTRENRIREELEYERQALVEEATRSIKNYMPPAEYRRAGKTTEKLYVPAHEHPEINFVGLLLGPRGNTLRQLQENLRAKLAIRGQGSVKDGRSHQVDGNEEPLHLVITADTPEEVSKAIELVNEVINKAINSPVGQNDLKRGQLRELAILNGTLRETKPYVPMESRKRPLNDITTIVCQICGNVGHFARDCLMNRKPGPPRGSGSEGSSTSRSPEEPPSKRINTGPGLQPPTNSQNHHSHQNHPSLPERPQIRADEPSTTVSSTAIHTPTSTAPPPPPAATNAPPPPTATVRLPPPPSVERVPPPPPPPGLLKNKPPPPPPLGVPGAVPPPPPPVLAVPPPPPTSTLEAPPPPTSTLEVPPLPTLILEVPPGTTVTAVTTVTIPPPPPPLKKSGVEELEN